MLSTAVDLTILLHLAGALILGSIVGYERYFRGRASGTQVYGIVSMASCAVTIMVGFPHLWYWSSQGSAGGMADPTRVVGSILTGVGFLGAGLIVRDGSNVRGLTTAASVWASSVIGILVGTGFYVPAIGLTALLVFCMTYVSKIERMLPARTSLVVSIRFIPDYSPQESSIRQFADERGFAIPSESISTTYENGRFTLQLTILTDPHRHANALSQVSSDFRALPNVESFTAARSTI